MKHEKDMLLWMKTHLTIVTGSVGQAVKDCQQDGIPCTGCRKTFAPKDAITDTEMVYALGTRTGSYRQYRKINHSGSFGGYNSYVYMLPDLQYGVFVAVNGGRNTYAAMREIIYFALDTLIGLKPALPPRLNSAPTGKTANLAVRKYSELQRTVRLWFFLI